MLLNPIQVTKNAYLTLLRSKHDVIAIGKKPFLILFTISMVFALVSAVLPKAVWLVAIVGSIMAFIVHNYVAFTWHRRVLLGRDTALNTDLSETQRKLLKRARTSFVINSLFLPLVLAALMVPLGFLIVLASNIVTQFLAWCVSGYIFLYFFGSMALIFPSIATGNVYMRLRDAFALARQHRHRIADAYIIAFLIMLLVEMAVTGIIELLTFGSDGIIARTIYHLVSVAMGILSGMLWAGLNSEIYKVIVGDVRDFTADSDT